MSLFFLLHALFILLWRETNNNNYSEILKLYKEGQKL